MKSRNLKLSSIALACSLALAPLAASAKDAPAGAKNTVVVNVDNFNKAQTDLNFEGILKQSGSINKTVSYTHLDVYKRQGPLVGIGP